jgi:hypothetical protein
MGVPITTPMGATGGAGIFTAVDHGPDIIALTTAIVSALTAQTVVLKQIQGTLATLTDAVGAVADNSKAASSAIRKVSRAVGNASNAISDAATVQQTMAVSMIEANNFNKEVVTQTLVQNGLTPPEMPSIFSQIKDQVKNGAVLNQITTIENVVKEKINDTIKDTTEWAKDAVGFDDIVADIEAQAKAIFTPMIAKSPETLFRDGKAAIGIPAI